jgi:hypothetical protein
MGLVIFRTAISCCGSAHAATGMLSDQSWNLFTILCIARLHAFRANVFAMPLKVTRGQTGEFL